MYSQLTIELSHNTLVLCALHLQLMVIILQVLDLIKESWIIRTAVFKSIGQVSSFII